MIEQHDDCERRVACELDRVLRDDNLWTAIERPYDKTWPSDGMARRALGLYDLTSPILTARLERFVEPLDHAMGVLRDIADACAMLSRRWADEERLNLPIVQRHEVDGFVGAQGLVEWAASLKVELPRVSGAHPADTPDGEGVDDGNNTLPPEELAASWSGTISAFLGVTALRTSDVGRDGIQGIEARDAASGLVALGRVCLFAARRSSQDEAIPVGVTQLFAAQGIFVAAWEDDRRQEVFPAEEHLREFLTSTGGLAWLVEHGAEIPPSLIP